MKTVRCSHWILPCVLFLGLFAGCRREDIRTCDIEIQGMTLDDAIRMKRATRALERYQGVLKDSYHWDMAANGNLVLTLKYDSMQVAQTNLRMSIAETGATVVFPTKTGPAGYVNEKPAGVE
ncbi:MAG: hypothetical protein ACI4R9_09445 [Kiritimatiellia bacterium]